MADSSPIIVGGGAAAGSPFALNGLLYVTNVNPPQISTFNAQVLVDSGSSKTYLSIANSAGVYNAITNATETFRVQGGMIVSGSGTDTVQIGRAASASNTGGVAIGANATNPGISVVIGSGAVSPGGGSATIIGNNPVVTFTGGGNVAVVIGDGATADSNINAGGSGTSLAIGTTSVAGDGDTVLGCNASGTKTQNNNYNVIIGALATQTLTRGNAVVIGHATTSAATLGVVVGANSSIGSGTKNTVLGQGSSVSGAFTNCVVLGQGSTAGASAQIVLGVGGLSIGANTAQIGTPGTIISTFVLGQGDTATTPGAVTMRFTNGSGADNAAGNLVVIAPLSTGAGTPATILFQTGHVGGSSSTLQTATTILQLGDAKIGFYGVTPVVRQVSGGLLANTIAGLVALGLFSS